MASVQLQNVTKAWGEVVVSKDINLDIHEGEFVVFVGPSGCGKSTLLRMIAGLETITSGDLFIGEKRMNDTPPAERGVGMVFQSYALYPHLSVAENMSFGLKLAGAKKEVINQRVNQVAEVLQLAHLLDRKPKALSGGQRQRVAIGRTLVAEPSVFLLDEPLSNLDAALRVQMRIEISRLHKRLGRTMIYVTHDQVEAMTLADQIVVMRDGVIVQQGAPLEIYDRPCNTFVARFIGSPPMNLLPGQRAMRDGQPGVACGALWFPLAERWHQAVAQQGDAPLIVGLRPQDILPDAHGAPATVNIMEVTGESTLLHLDWQGFPVHVQVAGRVAVAAQQTLGLTLRRENLHLFDAASGERLAETR